ncbi:hypothetical protein HGH93_05850 [Chitinophaga polysaccharea]|uniref:hypothetical protein n=1 Tax=Chitinophaga polysaccharea TaxID=1293035 RepID=UPI00145578C1|nr:hypothetical protein [Chitinophaga polysaccharea]NLR57612.1 hypothetical protein [Chitinophaga polysaccharea]
MKKYLLLLAGIAAACHQSGPAREQSAKDSTPVAHTITDTVIRAAAFQAAGLVGDYNGDGHTEYAEAILVKQGHGNPVEDGVPDEYAVRFSDTRLPLIPIGCCEARLVNEGDLNGDHRDELSVYQAPENGNTHSFTTWTFQDHQWKHLFAPFLIPGADYQPTDDDLQKRVFREKDTLYFMQEDVTDETFPLLKQKVTFP